MKTTEQRISTLAQSFSRFMRFFYLLCFRFKVRLDGERDKEEKKRKKMKMFFEEFSVEEYKNTITTIILATADAFVCPSLNRKQGNSVCSLFPLLSSSILKTIVCATA